MPPKKYCGEGRVPRGKVRGTPGECYLIGRKSGFVGGLMKGEDVGTEKSMKRAKVGKEIKSKAKRDFKSMSKDNVRDIARQNKVKNYSKMSKDDLVKSVATRAELNDYRR